MRLLRFLPYQKSNVVKIFLNFTADFVFLRLKSLNLTFLNDLIKTLGHDPIHLRNENNKDQMNSSNIQLQ